MKISTQTRYALRFLLQLSLEEGGARLTTHAIAKAQNLSEKYLEAIASKLRRAGMILSVKGAGGGYMLARDPSTITVGDVTRLMETSFFDVACVNTPCEQCAQYEYCALSGLFTQAHDQLSALLDGMTIADMRAHYRSRALPQLISG